MSEADIPRATLPPIAVGNRKQGVLSRRCQRLMIESNRRNGPRSGGPLLGRPSALVNFARHAFGNRPHFAARQRRDP